MSSRNLFIYLMLLSPSLAWATGNTTDVVTLMMLFFSIMAAALQATVVGILLSMKYFKHQWLVAISFIISCLNLLFFLTSISSLGHFGGAERSVWIVIAVVLVANPALIIMTFIVPTKQYKKLQGSSDEL